MKKSRDSASGQVDEKHLGESLATPSAKAVQAMKRLREAGGVVGYDEQGRLVRTLPGGGIEVIEN